MTRRRRHAVASPSLRALCSVALALLAACSSGGGGGGSAANAPGIAATVLSFPPGTAPAGTEDAVVQVVDQTLAPITNATVRVNGVTLPYVATSQEYEGAVGVAPGAAVNVTVTVSGHDYSVTAQQLADPPVLTEPAPGATWPRGCDGPVSLSGGSSAQADAALLLAMNPADPNATPILNVAFPAAGGSVTVGANSLPAGDVLLVPALMHTMTFPGVLAGSQLTLVVASVQPLHVANASYRTVVIRPGNQGVTPGQNVAFTATGPSCIAGGADQDLTAAATWSSSDPGVASVTGGGAVTGVAQGLATLSASVDGIGGSTLVGVRSFTRRAAPAGTDNLYAVTTTGTGLVAVGLSGNILTSPDGASWTAQSSGTTAQLTGVAASPSRIVAVQYGSSAMVTSTDGATWTPGGAGTQDSLWGVAWTGAEFVAVGVSGALFTSPDGLAWTPHPTGTSSPLTGVAAGAPVLLAVGGGNAAPGGLSVTSTDGVTWTVHDAPPASVLLRAVTWTGSQYVAVGDGVPVTSPDGITWTAQQGPSGMAGITLGNGEVMAVGNFGVVATSTDGQRWISWQVDPSLMLEGVAWTGSRYVLVGTYGAIYTSP